jgi:hypothetical protein
MTVPLYQTKAELFPYAGSSRPVRIRVLELLQDGTINDQSQCRNAGERRLIGSATSDTFPRRSDVLHP